MKAAAVAQNLLIWGCGLIIPSPVRLEWTEQWTSEAWYVRHANACSGAAWQFCLGAVPDAVAIRRAHPDEVSTLIRSPWACLAFLSLFAIFAFLGAVLFPETRTVLASSMSLRFVNLFLHDWMGTGGGQSDVLEQQVLVLKLTFMNACVITLISSTKDRLMVHSSNLRSWKSLTFFIAKLLAGGALVYFLAFAAAEALNNFAVQLGISVAGFILLLRWSFVDQEKRCPICLQRVCSPVQFGRPSCPLLSVNVREYICPLGHCVLQMQESPLVEDPVPHWQHMGIVDNIRG